MDNQIIVIAIHQFNHLFIIAISIRYVSGGCIIIDFWISCATRYNRPRALKWQQQYRWRWQRRDMTTTIHGRVKEGAHVRTVIDGVLFWQDYIIQDLGTISLQSRISFPILLIVNEQFLQNNFKIISCKYLHLRCKNDERKKLSIMLQFNTHCELDRFII